MRGSSMHKEEQDLKAILFPAYDTHIIECELSEEIKSG